MLPSDYLAQGWCQGTNAKDKQGEYIPAGNPDAVRWCFKGAVTASGQCYDNYLAKALELQNLPSQGGLPPGATVAGWNDQPERTQAEVVALAWRVEMALGLRPQEELRDPVVGEVALVN